MNRVMKDSAFALIGSMPSNWKLIRLKNILVKEKGAMKVGPFGSQLAGDDFIESGVPVYNQKTVVTNDFKNGDAFISSKKYETLLGFKLFPFDMLLTTRGTIGRVAIAPENLVEGIIHPCIIKFTADRNKADLRFLKHAINETNIVAEQFNLENAATTIPVVYSDTAKNIVLPFPPLDEQKAIADFLDDKCERIDALISAEEKTIEELRAYKKSIIQKATTKGIIKTALKDSGVAYFGDIPHDWEVVRNKNLFKIRKEIVGENFTDYELLSLTQRGVIKKDMDNLDGNLPESFATYQRVPKDTIVIALFDISTRSTSISGWSRYDGMISSAYRVLIPNEKVCLGYYDYLFAHIGADRCYVAEGKNIRCSIDEDTFDAIPIIYPPFGVQQKIAKYLDEKIADADNLITLKQQKITELKEYKKSLIYEYITGKKQPPQGEK